MIDKSRLLVGGFLVLIVFTAIRATAGQLSLSGQNPIWNPQQASSPEFVVGVANTSSTTDPLFAWQLGLEILSLPGATGSLQFNTAQLPPNYLLTGRSGGLTPAFTGPATSIAVISDSDSQFLGIIVPATGTALLETDFVASPNARGVFQIAVVPDQFQGASWFSSDFGARNFANAPFGGGPVAIGTVTVVPEPSGLLLCMSGVGVACMLWLGQRHTRKTCGYVQP
jgi:hypothetical protein